MGVLDCTQIGSAWVGGHELAEIWAGGARVWENAAPRIADHYGTGPGQIAIHLNSDGATLDGAGRVIAIANQGGAGPVFNATISGAPIPLDGHLLQISASTGFPILANPADLLGVRLMWVSTVSAVNATRYFGSIDRGPGGADYEIRTNLAGSTWTMQLWDNEGGTGSSVTLTPRVAIPTSIHLLELNFAASGVVTLYQDGVAISSANATGAFSAFPLDRIGQGTSSANMFEGQLGDVLGVILGGAAGDAIATARAWLAARYPALVLP